MAFTQKRLGGPTQLTTSNVTIYEVPSATTTIVKQIILTNVTASAKTATVRLAPLGVSPTNAMDILSGITLAANETLAFNCSLVMDATDELIAFANAATSVNITVSGIEEA